MILKLSFALAASVVTNVFACAIASASFSRAIWSVSNDFWQYSTSLAMGEDLVSTIVIRVSHSAWSFIWPRMKLSISSIVFWSSSCKSLNRVVGRSSLILIRTPGIV